MHAILFSLAAASLHARYFKVFFSLSQTRMHEIFFSLGQNTHAQDYIQNTRVPLGHGAVAPAPEVEDVAVVLGPLDNDIRVATAASTADIMIAGIASREIRSKNSNE